MCTTYVRSLIDWNYAVVAPASAATVAALYISALDPFRPVSKWTLHVYSIYFADNRSNFPLNFCCYLYVPFLFLSPPPLNINKCGWLTFWWISGNNSLLMMTLAFRAICWTIFFTDMQNMNYHYTNIFPLKSTQKYLF